MSRFIRVLGKKKTVILTWLFFLVTIQPLQFVPPDIMADNKAELPPAVTTVTADAIKSALHVKIPYLIIYLFIYFVCGIEFDQLHALADASSASPSIHALSTPSNRPSTIPIVMSLAVAGDNVDVAAEGNLLDAFGSSSPLTPNSPGVKHMSEADKAQWMQRRRDNHKEVERRRRDTINSGINELAKIVPECEKNKGSILHKTADYIKYLQKTHTGNVEKHKEEMVFIRSSHIALEEQVAALKAVLEATKRENVALKAEVEELRSLDSAKRRKLTNGTPE